MGDSRVVCGAAALAMLLIGDIPAMAQRDDPRWAHEVFMRVPTAQELVMAPAAAPGAPAQAAWKYRFTQPGPNWKSQTYNDNAWSSAQAGFEGGGLFDPLDVSSTPWSGATPDLWLRRKVVLTQADLERNALALWGRWDYTIEVYFNGVLAFSNGGWTSMYRWAAISQEARQALVVGQNTIAVKMWDDGGARYFDLGLVRNPLKTLASAGYNRAAGGAKFESAAREYFQDHLIPAGAIAVIKDDRIVSSWSFGWQDKQITTPLAHNAVFRLASLDKSPSFAALRTLIRDGYVEPVTGTPLTLDTLVFPLLGALGYTPPPGMTPDSRLNLITVRMLLEHTSGVGSVGSPADVAAAFGIGEEDLGPVHVVRWLCGAPLLADPGSGHYSNEGAALSRFLVNEFGGGIESYMRNRVDAGLDAPDFYLAAERLENRRPNEPWYQTHEPPFARWLYFEGGYTMAASVESYVNYLKGYHLWTGEPLLNPITGAYEPPDNGATVFFGAYSGTRTEAIQRRWDRVTFAAFVNCNEDVGPLGDLFGFLVDSMAPWEWFCTADVDADGFVTGDDFDVFVEDFVLGLPSADVNHDEFTNGEDFDLFVDRFVAGC